LRCCSEFWIWIWISPSL